MVNEVSSNVEKQVFIYANPNSKQEKEQAFLEKILTLHNGAKYVQETKRICTAAYRDTPLNRENIIQKILKDTQLSENIKSKLTKELVNLPPKILVVEENTRITVDIYIMVKDKISGSILKVPRYVQRFLRDIWRFQYFPNYTIVWYDWFEHNCKNFTIEHLKKTNIIWKINFLLLN